jgi:arylsulfatase A-like enzyme
MNSHRKYFPGRHLLFCLLATGSGFLACSAHGAEKPLNIIVILADDMGYSDPGCFGGEISTPTLDRLAAQGTRFTRFHNGGMCVVSRASLLTGKWWPRAIPSFTKTPLVSEHLRKAGYRTALIGKWHLEGNPMDRGFDHFFGFLGGFSDHFHGSADYRLDRKPFKEFGPDYYSSDAFTDRAIRFVTDSGGAPGNKPFFLYLSFQAPHNPLQAPGKDVLKYRGKYLAGWQAVREARFKRQLASGIVPAGTKLPPYPENLPEWNSLSPAQRDLEDLRMAVYAAMIDRMDASIGRLMDALEKSGNAENTLILFLSDNGADPFSVVDQPLLAQGKLPGDRNSNWQPGTGWAYASVTPWRLYKISQHGGGITTGGILHWPKSGMNSGSILATPLHVCDVLPTLLAAAGVEPAATCDGESFLPAIRGRPWKRVGPLFFQYMDNRAIRTHEWTLAEVDGRGWELFDLMADPLEINDLSGSRPELAADLGARWLDWWKTQTNKDSYQPQSTADSPHYKPQGDRGSGHLYVPGSMPPALSDRIPVP